jgi:photosystem II stability/assembly factor-like uncharacterized protein
MKLHPIQTPGGGAVSALAAIEWPAAESTSLAGLVLFAASSLGVYRWQPGEPEWSLLPGSPLGVICLAALPPLNGKRSLLAGTSQGIWMSDDLGESWGRCQLPLADSTILCLQCSPGGSLVLAGTLQDGILASPDGGKHWETRNFGLLDQAVFAIAFSPGYAQDATVFACAETAFYYSYNQARAWKELPFPEDALPALCLLAAPSAGDAPPVLFAGTEAGGLFRQTATAAGWQKLSLPSRAVNHLVLHPPRTLLAAASSGIYASDDLGKTFRPLSDQPEALSLLSCGDSLFAGWAEAGIQQARGNSWQDTGRLQARSFTGLLALGPASPRLLLYSQAEGIWASQEQGKDWRCLNPGLPFEDLYELDALPQSSILAAATAQGTWLSRNAGESWECIWPGPASLARFSPDRSLISILQPGEGVFASGDWGKTWQPLQGPWQKGGQVLALAAGPRQRVCLAYLEGVGEEFSLWQGDPGEMELTLRTPCPANPLVSIWLPPAALPDRPWFASLDRQVWKLSARRAGTAGQAGLLQAGEIPEAILSLAGVMQADQFHLFACTSQRLLTASSEAHHWKTVLEFHPRQAVKMALGKDGWAYFLLRGGAVFSSRLPL